MSVYEQSWEQGTYRRIQRRDGWCGQGMWQFKYTQQHTTWLPSFKSLTRISSRQVKSDSSSMFSKMLLHVHHTNTDDHYTFLISSLKVSMQVILTLSLLNICLNIYIYIIQTLFIKCCFNNSYVIKTLMKKKYIKS